MEVGDLVELSAYGKKLACLTPHRGDIGLVIGHNLVMWSKMPNFKCIINDRDVKRVK